MWSVSQVSFQAAKLSDGQCAWVMRRSVTEAQARDKHSHSKVRRFDGLRVWWFEAVGRAFRPRRSTRMRREMAGIGPPSRAVAEGANDIVAATMAHALVL